MMDVKNDFYRVVVNQQSSLLEIIKNLKNFIQEFECINFTSIIVICDTTMRGIYSARNDTLKIINSINTPFKN